MTLVLSQSISLLILNFVVLYGDKNKVEAKTKEIIPVPGWFNNVESFILPNAIESPNPNFIERHIETDDTLKFLKKKQKKRKRKKIANKAQEGKTKKLSAPRKKAKHRLGGNRMKFLKSDINVNDAKDSKLSASQEKQAQRKPVDIIVHIKMNE